MRHRLVIFFMLIMWAAGFATGMKIGYNWGEPNCPQEDSCSYVDHKWVPTEH